MPKDNNYNYNKRITMSSENFIKKELLVMLLLCGGHIDLMGNLQQSLM